MIPHRIWIRTGLAAIFAIIATFSISRIFVIGGTFAILCNVPVFRYALERWRPDLCQAIVFHEEDLTALQERQLQSLEKETIAQGGFANAEIVPSKVGSETDRNRKEHYSEVPLFLRFTILELDPKDPAEQLLLRMSGFEKDAQSEPLLSTVFGRGRALEVISAKPLNLGLIEDLTIFLCGACSYQVKERNPGFDLLLATNWNSELYGEEGEPLPPVPSLERTPTKPTPLTIPPGRKQ